MTSLPPTTRRQISLSARPTVEPDPNAPELKITFSLNEGKHTLLETAPTEVSYTVKNGTLSSKAGGKGARQELEYAAEFIVNTHRH